MCVAIYKPVGLKLDEDTLFNCFIKNPDGCGFAYTTGTELVVFKTMDYPTFLEEYEKCYEQYGETSPFIIHFRIATHGTVDIFNCHPFIVDNDHVFIHNGVISNVPSCAEKKKSDTQVFNELILQNLPADWFENTAIKYLLEDFISFSKIVVMNLKGEVLILNEAKGTWVDGVWFSNTLWKQTSIWEDISRGNYAKAGGDDDWDWSDYCLNCGKFIRYNIYSQRKGEGFCSGTCKDAYAKDMEKYRAHSAGGTPSYSQTCKVCGKSGTMVFSDYKSGKPVCFCSWACRDKELEARKQETEVTQQLEHKVKCLYCGQHKLARESFEVVFDESLVTGGAQIVEYICIDCMEDAVEAGILELTDELMDMACTILTEREGEGR